MNPEPSEANFASMPTPAAETVPAPELVVEQRVVHTCAFADCGKILPGSGWCSKRHRDMWMRANRGYPLHHTEEKDENGNVFLRAAPGTGYALPSNRIPENIRVEIAKGKGYWHERYKEMVAEYEKAKALAEEKARQQKAKELLEQAGMATPTTE